MNCFLGKDIFSFIGRKYCAGSSVRRHPAGGYIPAGGGQTPVFSSSHFFCSSASSISMPSFLNSLLFLNSFSFCIVFPSVALSLFNCFSKKGGSLPVSAATSPRCRKCLPSFTRSKRHWGFLLITLHFRPFEGFMWRC